jgi:hypothetical protein
MATVPVDLRGWQFNIIISSKQLHQLSRPERHNYIVDYSHAMMNRLFRTCVSTTRKFNYAKFVLTQHIGTIRSSKALFTENLQSRNRHFYIVQWPNQSLSVRLKQEDECSEEDYLNTVSRYSEMQFKSLNNVKEKPSQPLSFNISSQAMKELSQKLDASDAEISNARMSTLNIQLNKVTFIDRKACNSAEEIALQKSVVALQPVQKQESVSRRKKKPSKEAPVAEILTVKKEEGEPSEE